ncbi:MAG: type II toxin-antitoxin system mRNA interferase toxin, RelE/StbE family [archaeon]
MSYLLEISESLKRIFEKLKRKDPVSSEIIKKKIKRILDNPYQFKPLRGNMKGLRRVHIGKSFVLVYEILEHEKIVRLLDYEHHDKVYC